MARFRENSQRFRLLTSFAKRSIFDAWQGSKYACYSPHYLEKLRNYRFSDVSSGYRKGTNKAYHIKGTKLKKRKNFEIFKLLFITEGFEPFRLRINSSTKVIQKFSLKNKYVQSYFLEYWTTHPESTSHALTHLFPMLVSLRFSVFRGSRKGALGTNDLIKLWKLGITNTEVQKSTLWLQTVNRCIGMPLRALFVLNQIFNKNFTIWWWANRTDGRSDFQGSTLQNVGCDTQPIIIYMKNWEPANNPEFKLVIQTQKHFNIYLNFITRLSMYNQNFRISVYRN